MPTEAVTIAMGVCQQVILFTSSPKTTSSCEELEANEKITVNHSPFGALFNEILTSLLSIPSGIPFPISISLHEL